jgi:hypothetical protein
MTLKPTITVLALMLFSISVFGQYDYIQKLGNLGTIALPDTPKLVEKNGAKVYVAKYHDVIFIAEAGDISGGLKDVFRKRNLDSIYKNYINGLIGPTKGIIFYKNKLIINGQEGIEFGYHSMIKGQVVFSYHHAIALNDTLLMSGIWSSDSLSKDDKNLTLFFNGFKVKSKEQVSQANTREAARKTGKFIAILMIISLPIILGLGVVFIIRRIAYGKKNKTNIN